MKLYSTLIPDLLRIELDHHEDERGDFYEMWQQEKAEEIGLPPLVVCQCNVVRSRRGATRGIHAEPWDKFVHVAQGAAFAALVDLRKDQPTHGTVETFELAKTTALFIPQGVGNSYQALSDDVLYLYLTSDVWRPDADYTMVALDDPTLAISWPLPRDEWIVSEKDEKNLRFTEL